MPDSTGGDASDVWVSCHHGRVSLTVDFATLDEDGVTPQRVIVGFCPEIADAIGDALKVKAEEARA